jgi:signal transduction histidine kinase
MVPKLVKKYSGIREGVNEVKSGNLTYKIPVEADEKGPVTDFDSLASDINEISQATNAAVQNELKNQRLKTDLISNVSHDLKTPLTSMITYVDLLKTEGLDSEHAPEYLEILDEKTRRLKGLTENLFEAAKASSGNIPCEITDIDITAIVNQALAEMEDRLSERDLNVIVKNELSSPMVRADGQLLWRVIENLLSNVSKYAQTGSRVYVNLSDSTGNPSAGKGHALLEVKNISADPLNIPADELMERFKRGDESRNTEGSGLGLAIAKDLTRLMNGVFEITIDGDLFKASVMLEKA